MDKTECFYLKIVKYVAWDDDDDDDDDDEDDDDDDDDDDEEEDDDDDASWLTSPMPKANTPLSILVGQNSK